MFNLRNSFPGQERDEAVFVFARPYWVAFVPTALIFVFLFIVTLFGQIALANNWLIELNEVSINTGILFLGIFQLLTLIVFLVAIFDFYFDILIVTDRRLVDIDQEQLFFRRINELSLADVEDASSIIKGIFPTIFGYGNLEIQTAGTKDNFSVCNVLHPYELRSLILELAEQAHAGTNQAKRFPDGKTVGVINNQLITSPQQLQETGALLPNEVQRATSHATE